MWANHEALITKAAKQFVTGYEVVLSHFQALYPGHDLLNFGPFNEVGNGQLVLLFAVTDD